MPAEKRDTRKMRIKIFASFPFSADSKKMKITDIRATTVTVPLEAPLRHAAGAIGADLCERSSKSKPTRELSDSAKWAAAANLPKAFFAR